WIVSWLVLGGDGPYRQGSGDKSATDATDATDSNSAEGSAVVEEAAAEEETETDKVDDQKPVNIWRALFSVAFFAALFGAISNFWVQVFLPPCWLHFLGTFLGFSFAEVGF